MTTPMTEYSRTLFKDNPDYTCYTYDSRADWITARESLKGIGGSDSAAAIGRSKWMTNTDLWRVKTGRREREDISNNPVVRYGTLAEENIRRMYQLDTKDKYIVNYAENAILKSINHPCMLYSPDGLLEEKGTGRIGVLEIKTAHIRGNGRNWKDQIPSNYYVQVLHGMAVTCADFAELRAWLKYSDEYTAVKTYHIERSEVEEDIELVIKRIARFWQYVIDDTEPPMILGGV